MLVVSTDAVAGQNLSFRGSDFLMIEPTPSTVPRTPGLPRTTATRPTLVAAAVLSWSLVVTLIALLGGGASP